MRRFLTVVVVALSACAGSREVVTTPEERGERLASDPSFSGSAFNAFACTTCHSVSTERADAILPGAPLGGAVQRPNFWNGRLPTLGEAIDQCVQKFMRGTPLSPDDTKARDLYAYLQSIRDIGPITAQPFSVAIETSDLPAGVSTRGEKLWSRACRSCHGAPRTGEGRITNPRGEAYASIVPNDTLELHAKDGIAVARQVIIEKIRHGAYLGFPGSMPPFSRERLSDVDVGDILAYLDLYR